MVKKTSTVRPICIILNKETQQRLEYTAEQKFKAFGWGTTSDRLESEILQSITVDILDPTVCERNLLYTPVSEQICVGNPEGDTCRGDSGGPLSITVTINELFREVQHGIISVGARDCNNTSVLTRVSSYVDWIQGAINMNEDVNELPLRFESDVDEDKWLYKDCGGDTISSNLRAKITGRFFMAKGVLITNRFVLANARDLREPASSLKVDVMGKETSFGEYGVNLVLKHSNNEDDIALLRLNTLVTYTDHMKPICMLANSQLQQTGSLLSPFTVFDYVGTKGAVSVNTIDSSECSWNVQRSVGKDDVCIDELFLARP
ncbi:polyserase-2-like [Drosophila rhopaloa]|uniref:Peptidase S1 domain-containing protein n=1 Tax=Drosophila rhopaloa TaxID=1041015 RepID=A0ABM5J0W5_DRORH|nr:polyserase-2-like [Drosophila rhopaloa]